MTANRDRQRAAARARLEREMAERAEAARRRRRLQLWIGAIAAFAVLMAVPAWLVLNSDDKKEPAQQQTEAGNCAWLPLVEPDPAASAAPSGSPAPSASASTPAAPELPKGVKEVGTPPETSKQRSGWQTLTFTTNLGEIKVAVDTSKVPCTAASFTHLAEKKFYNDTSCHRMVNGGDLYVVQCGDPGGEGTGGPTYKYAEENLPENKRPAYPEGVLAMAKTSAPSTTGSQFFFVFKDTDLPAEYTIVGQVIQGLDVVKKVADGGLEPENGPTDGKPKTTLTVRSVTMSEVSPEKPVAPAPSPSAAASPSPSAAKK